MMPVCIRASSATELLRKVTAALVTDDGSWERSSPRGMPIREFRHCWYRLEDVSRCAAWLPGRKLNYAFMVAEFLWIFCGRDDLEMIGTYCKEIHKFSDDGKTFFGAYGPRWRGQIEDVVENLRRDPDSRQGVVSIWRPEALSTRFFEENAASDHLTRYTKDVPCTLSMQYLLRNGKLEAGVVMRSSDAWLGLPYDIFNFSMLMRAVASELKVEAGSLTMYLGSSHLYERNLEQARKVLGWERDEYDRNGQHPASRVFIAPPPGIECKRVEVAEEMIRGANDLQQVLFDGDVRKSWGALLSVLACHLDPDPSILCEPWDLLEETPF